MVKRENRTHVCVYLAHTPLVSAVLLVCVSPLVAPSFVYICEQNTYIAFAWNCAPR